MEQSKGMVKLAIFSVGILMMGAMAIASGLAVIGQHFSDVPQTSIQLLITIPCLVIIVATPIIGKLQEYVPIKTLVLVGVLCFLVGGIVPAFMNSFSAILVMRAIFGFGVAAAQALSPAMVAANFEGDERANVMGQLTSAQMLGCAAMVLISGYLAMMGWNMTFFVHLIALISLICVAAWLPNVKPMRAAGGQEGKAPEKVNVAGAYGWIFTMFAYFISGMILATYLAFLISEKNVGTAADAGQATMIFAIGGFLMGFVFGKLMQAAKNISLAIGFFMGVLSYLIIAYASNIFMVYVGSLIYGFAVTTIFASIMVGTSSSVNPASVPMAISLVTAGQNLGSFLCPYFITPLAAMLGSNINTNAFIVGAIHFAIMGLIAFFWGVSKNAKTKASLKVDA
ncbi:Predicted arabinose efflux permease, MFS family [Caldanaerovirga acetigignens]|uniref:Predicted arabinose efflux permease, MFS family n=1 Tax=Caldanaerovirga acetigignens TaxID=447595 RepID=A0A1M7HH73_9FIRM|nr:MFS transporter [Caldanaerovirga acetigignens]SHM27810.1 Predicted arabinose efflux permease, MFS family [Caldanaerovirga acetigignens]